MLPKRLPMKCRTSSESGRARANWIHAPSDTTSVPSAQVMDLVIAQVMAQVIAQELDLPMTPAEQPGVHWVLASTVERSAVFVAEFSGLGHRNHGMKHKNASSKFALSELHEVECVS